MHTHNTHQGHTSLICNPCKEHLCKKRVEKNYNSISIQIIFWLPFPFLRCDVILIYIRNKTGKKKKTGAAKSDLSIALQCFLQYTEDGQILLPNPDQVPSCTPPTSHPVNHTKLWPVAICKMGSTSSCCFCFVPSTSLCLGQIQTQKHNNGKVCNIDFKLAPDQYQDPVFFFCVITEPCCRWPDRGFQEIILYTEWRNLMFNNCEADTVLLPVISWRYIACTTAHTLDFNLSSGRFFVPLLNSHSWGTICHSPHQWAALWEYCKCFWIVTAPLLKVPFINILPS